MNTAAVIHELAPKDCVAEEYGRSLVAFRYGGELLVEQQVSVEFLIEETEMYPDFKTAVKEMLKNDKNFSPKLELSNQREHKIVNNQVVNAKGEPMVDVLDNGQMASSLLAEQDPDYGHQVTRDKVDKRLAVKFDAAPEGQTMWGISKDPKEALQKRPDIYAKRFGYKEWLVYFQTYSKFKGTAYTGSYAIDCQYPDVLREILAEHEMIIPPDESDDTWLDHAESAEMRPDEADAFARSIRREYYKRIGESGKRVSVDEFVDEHEEILLGFFKAYYPDMARVTKTGKNQDSLRELAKVMLAKSSEKLKPEIIHELMRINNALKLNDEAIKVLDSIIRYAAVEELRKHIEPKLVPQTLEAGQIVLHSSPQYYVGQNIHNLLVENVYTGLEAGRSYSGCPGNIDLANSTQKEADSDGINRQEAFGGNGKEGRETILKCVTCPLCKKEGVDAHITYNDESGEKTITCSGCKQSKTYKI